VFNVGIGEIAIIVLVCLVVFGPERLPQIARQIGRFLGQLRLTTQGALDQLKQEAELKDVNLPDLRVGSLRSQARDYVRELLDIEGQMAELEREREQLKASLDATTKAAEEQVAEAAEAQAARAETADDAGITNTAELPQAKVPASSGEPAPVDPEAT
jgi:sec-independent protein translocase protein TatB